MLPLSIGDGELCETALTTVSVPEMFRYWLQGGRITVGFLGGAQIDRFANLNTTVVGAYDKPKVRLPGGGGAPEIATSCGEIFIIMAQGKRSFVDKLDFITSLGHGEGGDHRERLGVQDQGPDPAHHRSLRLRAGPGDQGDDRRLDPSGRDARADRRRTPAGRCASPPTSPRRRPPTAQELDVLRELHAAHARAPTATRRRTDRTTHA